MRSFQVIALLLTASHKAVQLKQMDGLEGIATGEKGEIKAQGLEELDATSEGKRLGKGIN